MKNKKQGSILVYSMVLLAFSASVLIMAFSYYLQSVNIENLNLYTVHENNQDILNESIVVKVNEYINKTENLEKFKKLDYNNKKIRFDNITVVFMEKGVYIIKAVNEDYTITTIKCKSKEIQDENKIVLWI